MAVPKLQKYGNIISPAATGIGCFGDSVSIYMISVSKDINTCIENPNQTPAYKYPPKYGIKSPLFARATYTDNGSGRGVLYVSGTASISARRRPHRCFGKQSVRLAMIIFGFYYPVQI
jgi:hypothetical protein